VGETGVRIVMGVEGDWRTIQVLEAEPDQRAALEELGFGPDLVQRYPPGTRHLDRAVANLGQVAEEMVGQKIAGSSPGWAGVLDDLLSRAGRLRVPLAVVGSVALAVRGIAVAPGDIDVITTLEGADTLADSYRDVLVTPVAAGRSSERFGRAFTGGIRVEWLGNPPGVQQDQWPLAAAAWSVASPFEEVRWEGRTVRVPPLEVQRRVESQRHRPGRVAAIDEYRWVGGQPG
jgi:hypothetical protein